LIEDAIAKREQILSVTLDNHARLGALRKRASVIALRARVAASAEGLYASLDELRAELASLPWRDRPLGQDSRTVGQSDSRTVGQSDSRTAGERKYDALSRIVDQQQRLVAAPPWRPSRSPESQCRWSELHEL
jgi:hypothetical protein